MKSSQFFFGQFVSPEDLNNIETSAIDQIKSRTQGITLNSVGVLGSVVDRLDGSKNFFVTKDSPVQMTIAPGKALDINGEVITVPAAKTLQYAISDPNYIWSSGYASKTNYIKLKYQEASSSVKSTFTGASSYTKFESGYYITIDGIPNVSSEILLGTYTSDTSGGIVGAIVDERDYISIVTTASASVLDPTSIESVLGFRNVEDHVRATGSMVSSNINAHGIAAVDIKAVASTDTNILLWPTDTTTLNLDEVYRNSLGSTMFVSCTVKMDNEYDDSIHVAMLALMTSPNGTAGPLGSLSPPYYVLSARYFWKGDTLGATYGTRYDVTGALRGFVPADWFYQITYPLDDAAGVPPGYTKLKGTILNSLRYW